MGAEHRVSLSGPWAKDRVSEFLAATTVPIRVSCHGTAGYPVIASLWFVPMGGQLWCATQREARLARLLEADERCAFEVAPDTPPYCGVRGQGAASLHPDRGPGVLRAVLSRYGIEADSPLGRRLLNRADSETAIAIDPLRLTSWDYRARMASSIAS